KEFVWNAFPYNMPLIFDRMASRPEWNHLALNAADLRSAVSVERDHVLDTVRMVVTSGFTRPYELLAHLWMEEGFEPIYHRAVVEAVLRSSLTSGRRRMEGWRNGSFRWACRWRWYLGNCARRPLAVALSGQVIRGAGRPRRHRRPLGFVPVSGRSVGQRHAYPRL